MYLLTGRILVFFSVCTAVSASTSNSDNRNDYIQQVQQRIAQYGFDGFYEWVSQSIDDWSKEVLRIGITGGSGVGKSTFINTMRGLGPGHPDAAETCSNKQCTLNIQDYPDLKNPNLTYYDLPGIGTPNFLKEEYAKKVKLDSYDFVIILSANRFTENDAYLAQELHRFEKKFFFVRTKIDQDIKTEREDQENQGKTFDEEAYLAETKRFCSESIKQFSDTHPVFVISGRLENYAKWDFPKLVEHLIQNAPGLKREALIHTISPNSHAAVEQKAALIEQRILKVALVSAFAAAVPIPGLSISCDLALMIREIRWYLKYFSVDLEALDILSKILRTNPETLLKIIYGAQVAWTHADSSGIKKLVMQKLSEYALANTAEEVARYIPIIGQAVAPVVSFLTVHKTLNYFLGEIKAMAHHRVDEILARC
jgi:predicted GTPase